MTSLFRQQPSAFYLIFMLEFWERFGFYTVNGILAYFFVHQLGYSESVAFYTFGAYSALLYGLVALGGFVGDKILGTKRTIVLGMAVLAIGYLALSMANAQWVFVALGIICVGNGLFKANPSSLLAKCYEKNDQRLHGAFTLYYMAINIGSMFSLVIGPNVSEHFGWSSAFFISFVGLLSALLNYFVQRKQVAKYSFGPDKEPLTAKMFIPVLIGVVALCYACSLLLKHVALTKSLLVAVVVIVCLLYGYYMLKEKSSGSRKKMGVAFILMIEGVIFFTLYQQMPTSINFFAIHHVSSTIFGFAVNPQTFQVLNPIWIMLMSPVMAYAYAKLNKTGHPAKTAHKFALGMTLCAFSFLVLYVCVFFANSSHQVSSWWLVLSYFFQSTGELLVSALGVAMVAELVPEAISGFIMGMWFLSSSIAGFTGAYVASLTRPQDVAIGAASLHVYGHVFLEIGLYTLAISLVMWMMAPKLHKLANPEAEPATDIDADSSEFAGLEGAS